MAPSPIIYASGIVSAKYEAVDWDRAGALTLTHCCSVMGTYMSGYRTVRRAHGFTRASFTVPNYSALWKKQARREMARTGAAHTACNAGDCPPSPTSAAEFGTGLAPQIARASRVQVRPPFPRPATDRSPTSTAFCIASQPIWAMAMTTTTAPNQSASDVLCALRSAPVTHPIFDAPHRMNQQPAQNRRRTQLPIASRTVLSSKVGTQLSSCRSSAAPPQLRRFSSAPARLPPTVTHCHAAGFGCKYLPIFPSIIRWAADIGAELC